MLNRWLGGSDKTPSSSRSSNGTAPQGAHLKPSIISDGVVVDGDFTTDQGILHLDGRLVGHVRVTSLTIGATGYCDGSVRATSITVRGVLIGDVTCDDLVLDSSARVSGTVQYRTIAIAGGAILEGALVRHDGRSATPAEAVGVPA